jgi:hypothetical protein
VEILQFVLAPHEVKLIIRGATRTGVSNFFRTFAGTVAQKITKSTKGIPLKKSFWSNIVFTQLMNWNVALHLASKIMEQYKRLSCHILYQRDIAPG